MLRWNYTLLQQKIQIIHRKKYLSDFFFIDITKKNVKMIGKWEIVGKSGE